MPLTTLKHWIFCKLWFAWPALRPIRRPRFMPRRWTEVRARWDSLSPTDLQRLMLGLLGDPVRAKVAKEVASILKTMSKVARQAQLGSSRPRPATPYARGPCYNCGRWGHLARTCRAPRTPFTFGRGRGAPVGRGRGNTR